MINTFSGALCVGLVMSVSMGCIAAANYKTFKGHVTSDVVSTFSNDETCSNQVRICTEGKFSGRLKGHFTFVAQNLGPFTLQDQPLLQTLH